MNSYFITVEDLVPIFDKDNGNGRITYIFYGLIDNKAFRGIMPQEGDYCNKILGVCYHRGGCIGSQPGENIPFGFQSLLDHIIP